MTNQSLVKRIKPDMNFDIEGKKIFDVSDTNT